MRFEMLHTFFKTFSLKLKKFEFKFIRLIVFLIVGSTCPEYIKPIEQTYSVFNYSGQVDSTCPEAYKQGIDFI